MKHETRCYHEYMQLAVEYFDHKDCKKQLRGRDERKQSTLATPFGIKIADHGHQLNLRRYFFHHKSVFEIQESSRTRIRILVDSIQIKQRNSHTEVSASLSRFRPSSLDNSEACNDAWMAWIELVKLPNTHRSAIFSQERGRAPWDVSLSSRSPHQKYWGRGLLIPSSLGRVIAQE